MRIARERTRQQAPPRGAPVRSAAGPSPARPGPLQQLQRQLGNQRIQRACSCQGSCAHCRGEQEDAPRVQTKLTVGAPGDRFEREADLVARQVVAMRSAGGGEPQPAAADVRIQRFTRGAPGGGHGAGVALPPDAGRALSPETRAFMEPRFGTDFSAVRVHTGSRAEETAARLGARAFAHGTDIWLGRGTSERDLPTVAHELTHVVQQSAASGPARPIQRLVEPNRVSCEGYPRDRPIFTAIGTDDPVGVLQAADARAIELLDSVIDTLTHGRTRVAAGAPAAWPTIGDTTAVAMQQRLRLNPEDPAVWTGSGPRTVEIILRWLGNVRGLLASGALRYTCLSGDCDPGDWAFVFPGTRRVHLCRPFWHDTVDNQAITLIHEVAHLYYGLEDAGGGAGNAHCLEQFVADLNDIPVLPDFVGACRAPRP